MPDATKALFQPKSGFSAADLAGVLRLADADGRAAVLREILQETAHRFQAAGAGKPRLEHLNLSRVLHSLGTALAALESAPAENRRGKRRDKEIGEMRKLSPDLWNGLTAAERRTLIAHGVPAPAPALALASRAASAPSWPAALRDAAFQTIGRTIVFTQAGRTAPPGNALRADEIIWGRAPARLDLGGGWSDTPPYSLENGGCVINAAVDLNGQPPIQVFARVIEEPEIRINSIDHGSRETIRTLAELLDYRQATSQFGLAKAALVLSGFAPHTAPWPAGTKSLARILERFGGGIELNTLAAIPSGSGLGTSSIMGAVLLAVINRMTGVRLAERDLFHEVLKLEQELTTGGGWQDQIGGVLPGVKVITSGPGLVPDPWAYYVLPDCLDPRTNGGTTLLFYTGIRRLAKNILRYVVGNYLDRDPGALDTLRALQAYPAEMREAMARKDHPAFGRLIDVAWRLNIGIDPDSTTPAIEAILDRIRPRILGAKLLGAGGGGFLLIVCRSARDAKIVRRELESRPPNARARFFDYRISAEGLTVTVC